MAVDGGRPRFYRDLRTARRPNEDRVGRVFRAALHVLASGVGRGTHVIVSQPRQSFSLRRARECVSNAPREVARLCRGGQTTRDEFDEVHVRDWTVAAASGVHARCSAVAYIVIVSCRRHGINPQGYLTDVLRRLPTTKNTDIDTLTPAHWQPAPQV